MPRLHGIYFTENFTFGHFPTIRHSETVNFVTYFTIWCLNSYNSPLFFLTFPSLTASAVRHGRQLLNIQQLCVL
jgi:hypothetical protein